VTGCKNKDFFLRKRLEAGLSAKRPSAADITVGDWLRKFTRIETSPRTGINISENGSCSEPSAVNATWPHI
jgi:hypothetical protein